MNATNTSLLPTRSEAGTPWPFPLKTGRTITGASNLAAILPARSSAITTPSSGMVASGKHIRRVGGLQAGKRVAAWRRL